MSRYVPIGPPARGGIGIVMFCEDKNLDRKVAVKFVPVGGEHRRLLDELGALQRIRSKHVVEIFDVAYFPPGVQMGIVEEFIDGETLEHMLGKVTFDPLFLRLLFQMASGLADIHAVGVVHRDIKPSNMLIDKGGILKITDFNLARPTGDARTQGFVGTRGYAAPELYSDDEVEFDAKVDVYALCVTAYVLLRGLPLPPMLAARPPRPDAWKAAGGGFAAMSLPIDQELVRLLDAGLSDDPRRRPSTAEILQRVARILLRGKHRALFVDEGGNAFELNAAPGQRHVRLAHQSNIGAVTIDYDDLDFRAVSVTGEVWVNNVPLSNGAVLPGSCVIALGAPDRSPRERVFITMDVSHPEVVL